MTPAALHHYADVVEREADARRHQPEFRAWLLANAAKARIEAGQQDLFGGVY